MSRQGLKIAIEVGLSRNKFINSESAEKYFKNLKLKVFDKVLILQNLQLLFFNLALVSVGVTVILFQHISNTYPLLIMFFSSSS
jgi:hypothetical protein